MHSQLKGVMGIKPSDIGRNDAAATGLSAGDHGSRSSAYYQSHHPTYVLVGHNTQSD